MATSTPNSLLFHFTTQPPSRLHLRAFLPPSPFAQRLVSWHKGSSVSRKFRASRAWAFHCFAQANDSADDQPLNAGPESVQVDLNLPRRRLKAEFTCNACGVRTERLINPHAYSRGTVYVQCSGCEVYHQLIDNLGLVVEFRYETED